MKQFGELKRQAFNFFLLGTIVIVILFHLALFYVATIYGKSHLTPAEKQEIAVKYLCNGQWKGVQIFCGQQAMDGKAK